MNQSANSKVIVGQFGSVYGVRGWIHVNSFTDEIFKIIEYPEWWICYQGKWQQVFVTEYKIHDKELVVKLKGCDDRDVARTYTNFFIGIPHDSLPELPEDEYYWADLIGLKVVNIQAQELGYIDHILATGANDVFVLKGKCPCLVPYTDEVVKSIDLNQKLMIIDWDLE